MSIANALLMAASNSLHPYTQAWINAMTVKPSSAAAKVYDNFVRALVNGNVWNDLDTIGGCPTHDAQSSLINPINPGTHDFTIASGTPVFTPYSGWQAPTGTAYLESSALNTMSKFTQNSGHIGVYTKTDSAANTYDIGASEQTVLNPRGATGLFVTRINNSTASAMLVASSNSIGHWIGNRSSNTAMQGYKNGVDVINSSINSIAVSSSPFRMLGAGPQQSRRELTLAHCGSSLNPTQAAALSAAINQFVTEAAAL